MSANIVHFPASSSIARHDPLYCARKIMEIHDQWAAAGLATPRTTGGEILPFPEPCQLSLPRQPSAIILTFRRPATIFPGEGAPPATVLGEDVDRA